MKGFTLLEILIVVSIALLLVVVSIAAIRNFSFQMDLDTATQEIVATLRSARIKTVASEDASRYGVYFDISEERYVFFKGDIYNPDDSNNIVYNLPGSIEISTVDLEEGGSSVIFNRIEGTTTNDGNVEINLIKDPSHSRTIYIQSSGQVGIGQAPSAPSNNRIKDSRHVHFDLGWSIQSATQLKFDFVDAGQIETVEMADYFNADKNEFDWSGTFSVGGKTQEFRVHTHNLTAFDTLLCIHRDRNEGKNNEEVKIFIVDGGIDKLIAHYLADSDDTVLKGDYVWNLMEIQ